MLVIITAEEALKEETKQIQHLFQKGLQILHVRKPSFSEERMRWWLANFTPAEQRKMMLHQHHFLKENFPLKGIHFTEEKKLELKNNSLIGIEKNQRKNLTLSASFHNTNEAENQTEYDYVFLSPVFTSISKKNYSGKEFQLSHTEKPVLALGGITENNLSLTKKMGYQGVAVLGSIWSAGEPLENFKKIQKTYSDVYQ